MCRQIVYVTYAQCITEKSVSELLGKDKMQTALERLDRLTKDEGLSAVAQTLGVIHGIVDSIRVVLGGVLYFHDF